MLLSVVCQSSAVFSLAGVIVVLSSCSGWKVKMTRDVTISIFKELGLVTNNCNIE